jgi:RimJ/RimL family protein N-acetyltransferase
MKIAPVTLEGRMARLEPIDASHAADLAEVTGEPELWRLMSFGSLLDPRALDAFIAERSQDPVRGDGLCFAIVDLSSGKAVGSTSLFDFVPVDERIEIGRTWLGRPFWRTGINTECKYLLLSHAFGVIKCRRVQLQTDALNLRSQAAIERLGAVKEGVLRRNKTCGGGRIRDSVIYSILEAEWPAVKARLEGFMRR